MKARSFIITFFVIPILLYVAGFMVYLANPVPFHFRAWELFQIFVYRGYLPTQQQLWESGDSARHYLVQRYRSLNRVSVNQYGNRIACYRENEYQKPSLLLVGDSQLFGAETDDSQTWPAHLCQQTQANIYNGARRHEMALLRHPSLHFDSILFTKTEHDSMDDSFCAQLDGMAHTYGRALPEQQFLIPSMYGSVTNLRKIISHGHRFYRGFISAKVKQLFYGINHHFTAPDQHLIRQQFIREHAETDVAKEVACAKRLTRFFQSRGIKTGFLYFPAHQTLYGAEAGVDVDEKTQSYLDKLYTAFSQEGLRTMDSKSCLEQAKKTGEVYLKHDTHLSGFGYKSLAECIKGSTLATLFK